MGEFGVAIGVLLAIAAVIGILAMSNSHAKTKEVEERQRRNREQAQRFFTGLQGRETLPVTQVSVVLKEGELGVFEEPSVLFETRAYRLYGGGGTRLRGIYLGGGASESHQRLREIDSGTLVLTNMRLIFDGEHENRSLNLSEVLSANPWSDAVEISSSRRQKSQIYAVRNPIIWAQMIQLLASGKIEMSAEQSEPVVARTEEDSIEAVSETSRHNSDPELDSTITKLNLGELSGISSMPRAARESRSSWHPEADNLIEKLGKGAARSIGTRVGRGIVRGVLGSFFGTSKRRSRR
ncbi:MAG: hypothetical protein ACREQ7_16100 [Candidatus Binatia bacterium]